MPMMEDLKLFNPIGSNIIFVVFFFSFFSWYTNLCVANLVTLPALQISSERLNFSGIVSFRHLTNQSIMPSSIKINKTREGGRVRQLSDDPKKPYLDKKYSN